MKQEMAQKTEGTGARNRFVHPATRSLLDEVSRAQGNFYSALFLLPLLIAGVLTGCHKKEQPRATENTPAAAPQAAAPEPAQPATAPAEETPLALPVPQGPPPAPVAARAQNQIVATVEGDIDPFLTSQLKAFVMKEQRLPNSFAEFANRKLDSIPRPPEGKRWVIDAANLQVKAVKDR